MVLNAINEYHHQFNKIMKVEYYKGGFIVDMIAKRRPRVMIELGGYMGYSAILFGNAIRKFGGKQYISIEKNPEMAAIATQLVKLAGLGDIVRIEVGSSNEVLKELICETKEIDQVQLILMDHQQDLYLQDLWLLEQQDILTPGSSVVLADITIMPGAPEYLEWVQATPLQKKNILQRTNVGPLAPNPNLVYSTVVTQVHPIFAVCLFFDPPRIFWEIFADADQYRIWLQFLKSLESGICNSLCSLGFPASSKAEVQCRLRRT